MLVEQVVVFWGLYQPLLQLLMLQYWHVNGLVYFEEWESDLDRH
jgi:hypothetical protein